MGERIAFASWNYISLVCSEHGNELVLDEAKGKPVYRCGTENCALRISSVIYEKILEDVISFQNKGTLLVGASWKRKSELKIIELTVKTCANGKRPEIAVRIL